MTAKYYETYNRSMTERAFNQALQKRDSGTQHKVILERSGCSVVI